MGLAVHSRKVSDGRGAAVKRPFYLLEDPVPVSEKGSAFFCTYASSRKTPVHLYSAKNSELLSFSLPPTGGERIQYRFPLGIGSRIYGFFFEADEGEVKVYDTGIAPAVSGISFEGEVPIIGRECRFKREKEGFRADLDGSFSPGAVISYDYSPPEGGAAGRPPVPLSLRFQGGGPEGKSKELLLYPKIGFHSVYIPEVRIGFTPAFLDGEVPDGGFSLRQILPFDPGEEEKIVLPSGESVNPVPLDTGSVLAYPQSAWRQEEFELFSWNLFPRVLIFDTRDYTVQARFFKRIAFFVEKMGYTGRLLTDKELEGKHGWNAHDYRDVDLAAFFQAAEDRKFPLGEEEESLKAILLSRGIIRRTDEGYYSPGAGAVVSISRESPPVLRRKFLLHECLHGIFFTSKSYRNRCFDFWDRMPEDERYFWTSFFRSMNYDPENPYLMVNEVQAYLMQQPVKSAEGYFRKHRSIPALMKDPKISGFLDSAQTRFAASAQKIREVLLETTGIWADHISCLKDSTQ